MLLFFKNPKKTLYVVAVEAALAEPHLNKLKWLFGNAELLDQPTLSGSFVGPRAAMITPWSTNAVEITQNMDIQGITRIEEFHELTDPDTPFDPMLFERYDGLTQDSFTIDIAPQTTLEIDDIEAYNQQEGLALSREEVAYLENLSKQLNRKLTDSEVFGFSQINSEHCRHKIFNGTFVIDGEEKPSTLFKLIKKTSQANPNSIVSAYKDNVAFIKGATVDQFAPKSADKPDFYEVKPFEAVLSLKAETHNFPTTVEPFNGAATGSGGEIRDRLAGGQGSLPLAGTAVYMTAYPRLEEDRPWEQGMAERKWLYQTPMDILIKASNGASDFGNKFGQPLIAGSVLTFEHQENGEKYAYDKVVMLAGGVGYGTKRDCLKKEPQPGNKVVVVGGDNYRIGLGGGSVSSVDTGRYSNGIELNAIQRANPEMQKRAYNLVRALVEENENPVVSIHDHGSAGHLNCLSELVEDCGGKIEMDKLPIGDKTLSAKEIIANESQERMGLLIDEKHIDHVRRIAERERAPMYVVGETTGDAHFSFVQKDGVKPFDLDVAQMFGHSPKTIMKDETVERKYADVTYNIEKIDDYVARVLQLEAVACKDWLTNKVDRSVTGRIARQQCQGQVQLPLSDCGVVALDYRGYKGIATAIGHAPQAGLASPEAGSVLSVAEALTNIVWAPLAEGMDSISLSANWMWPCRAQKGEDARLYSAVKALSDFCCAIGVNVPTGKDSLSLTQQYPNGEKIVSPGTVIVSSGAEVSNVRKVVSPVLVNNKNTRLYHIDFSFDEQRLGGSAFAQSLGKVGSDVPTVKEPRYFCDCFDAIQEMIQRGWILAGHDISAGGMITTLLEMTFANPEGGLNINLHDMQGDDIVRKLFAENPGVIIQVADEHNDEVKAFLEDNCIGFARIGNPNTKNRMLTITDGSWKHEFDIDALREKWYETSYLLDRKQTANELAEKRHNNYKVQPIEMKFNADFTGTLQQYGLNPNRWKDNTPITHQTPKAAIIREKGTNGDREMAYSLYLAGFEVKDVTMTDLISGRETLEEVNMIVFCGGFSNSDVLGSAKGWAGAFLYNPKAKQALDKFYARKDTLSLGICNGCQLMVELNLINPEHKHRTQLVHNDSHKFESAYLGLNIPENKSVMFGSLSGNKLGIWVAHGEGKFMLPEPEDRYNIVAKYNYAQYPGNPNGSNYNVAGICSNDGRHLAMMPHLERSIFPWQQGWYPMEHRNDEVTPWIEAFVNARKWVEEHLH